MADDKELKDQRIPIMMTASELQAIDDWSFSNRIRSRGEAIRRLCQIGLMFDEHRLDLARRFRDVAEPTGDFSKLLEKHSADISNPEGMSDFERELLKLALRYMVAVAAMATDLRTVVGVAKNYKEDGDLSDIMKTAKQIFDIKMPRLNEWKAAIGLDDPDS